MFNTFKAMLAITGAFTLALLSLGVARVQGLTDRDAKEIADYVLTDAALAKYTKAAHKLQSLTGNSPQDCDHDEGSPSLNAAAGSRSPRIPRIDRRNLHAVKVTAIKPNHIQIAPGRTSRVGQLTEKLAWGIENCV